MKGNIMDINLRTDAPDQTDIIDPTLLSEGIEQLKTVGAQVLAAEIKLKELKLQYDYISGITIPQLMDKMNLVLSEFWKNIMIINSFL